MLNTLAQIFTGFLIIGILIAIILIIIYVYGGKVWSTIAKKLNYSKPWLAWIPIANFFLLPILAEYHWVWGFILLTPIIATIILKFLPFFGLIFTVLIGLFILLIKKPKSKGLKRY